MEPKFIMRAFFLLITSQLLILSQAQSQDNARLNAAREIIASTETCALITLDNEGRPRTRAMETLLPEEDFTIWLGTNPKSRKVSQIKKDPRATIYYLDKDESGYVILYGKAEIINNKKAKETHWKEEWKAFYPNKEEDYVLIKFSPEWMEVVSNSRGIFGDSITWQPTKVFFDTKN
jgi:general stress protein 26